MDDPGRGGAGGGGAPEGSGGRAPAGGGIATLIRFALRTGRVVVGPTGAKVEARRRGRGVILVASDMAPAKVEKICRWAAEIPVPVGSPLSGAALAEAAGRDRCEVIYIYDRDLSRSIVNALGADRKI